MDLFSLILLLTFYQTDKLGLTAQTGKNEKVHSLHSPDIKFIGKKQLVLYKSSNYTLKITNMNMWNLGQFRENLIFCKVPI